MKSESKLVLEIWEIVRDQIAAAKRTDTAISLVQAFEEFGFEQRDLQDIVDDDIHLTRAYHEVFDIEVEPADYDEPEDE